MYKREEIAALKKDFWEDFYRYSSYYSRKIGEPIKWKMYKTGISGAELKFDLEKKIVRVVFEINIRDKFRKEQLYNDFLNYQTIIEEGFEEKLMYDKDYMLESGKSVSRIYVELKGMSFFDRANWTDIFKFMAENMYRLQTNLDDVFEILKSKM